MRNIDRLVAFNALTAPFGVTFAPGRRDAANTITFAPDCDRTRAVDALRTRAAELRASGRTPDGYRRGDAVEAGAFEIAAARVRVAV